MSGRTRRARMPASPWSDVSVLMIRASWSDRGLGPPWPDTMPANDTRNAESRKVSRLSRT